MFVAPDRADWRWSRAAEIARELSPVAGKARLAREDDLTRRAYEFVRASESGRWSDDLPVVEAHKVWTNRPTSRTLIEAFLLAGASDDEIAEDAWLDPQVVGTYHDLFFAVRPALDRSIWISDVVFGGVGFSAGHKTDMHGVMLRTGWYLKKDLLRLMVGRGLSSDMPIQAAAQLVKNTLVAQASTLAYSANTSYETPDWFRELIVKAEDAGSGGSASQDFVEATDRFLRGVGLSVADPTEERNLQLPKVEKRRPHAAHA